MPTSRRPRQASGDKIPARAAQLVWVASQFARRLGVEDTPSDDGEGDEPATWSFEDWSERELGRRLTEAEVRGLAGAMAPPSPRGRRPKDGSRRRRPTRDEVREATMREWSLVREERLGLRRVLFRIPGRFDENARLIRSLEGLAGIRQLIELKRSYEVLAIGIVQNEREADGLRARIQEHVTWGNVEPEDILSESFEATPLTWRDLATQQLNEV